MHWAERSLYGKTQPCPSCGVTVPASDDLCKYCRGEFWYEGQKTSFTEWSRISGVPRKTLYERLRVHHWPEEQAFWRPENGCRSCGKTSGVSKWHSLCSGCRPKREKRELSILDDAGDSDDDMPGVIRIGDRH